MESTNNSLDSLQLRLNNDESNCSTQEEAQTQNPKQRRVLRSYKCILEFENCQFALQRLEEPIGDVMYIFRYTRSTISGDKDFYHCQGHQKCSKTLYILRHSDSLKASIWLCTAAHAHIKTNGGALPAKSVAHIKKLFEEKARYTNNEIISSLRRHNCPQLTKIQINNLKSRLKQQKIGPANCCLQELVEWSQRKREIPEDHQRVAVGIGANIINANICWIFQHV